jgi:hypothetical protein
VDQGRGMGRRRSGLDKAHTQGAGEVFHLISCAPKRRQIKPLP